MNSYAVLNAKIGREFTLEDEEKNRVKLKSVIQNNESDYLLEVEYMEGQRKGESAVLSHTSNEIIFSPDFKFSIKEFSAIESGNISIDFSKAEGILNFKLSKDIKNFYTRTFGTIEDSIKDLDKYVKRLGTEWDTWIYSQDDEDDDFYDESEFESDEKNYKDGQSYNDDDTDDVEECEDCGYENVGYEVRLNLLNGDDIVQDIYVASKEWMGEGNDFGHRIWIGEILIETGPIYLIYNNDTDKVEWADLEYGYFDVYEENPHGIFADSIGELLSYFQ